MSYVMMPVPEEHVQEVMGFILRTIERASVEDWDADSVASLFGEVDEAGRSLLAYVAKASLDGVELADRDAARQVQLSVREIAGIMNEFHALVREWNRPPIVTGRSVTERLPNGKIAEKRLLVMEPELAEFVKLAQAAELRDAPHPLSGTGE